jgi:hypothetical protein
MSPGVPSTSILAARTLLVEVIRVTSTGVTRPGTKRGQVGGGQGQRQPGAQGDRAAGVPGQVGRHRAVGQDRVAPLVQGHQLGGHLGAHPVPTALDHVNRSGNNCRTGWVCANWYLRRPRRLAK